LEKKVQMDVRYIFFGGGAMAVGQVAVTGISLVSAIAFANLISKDTYGTYQYILTTGEFLTTFSLIGIGRASITSVARGKDGVLNDAFKKGLLWGIGALAAGLGVGGYYFFKGDWVFAIGIAASTIFTLVITSAKVYIPFLNGRKLFRQTSSFNVLGILIPGTVMLTTLYLTQDVLSLVLAFLLSSTATNLFLFYWCQRYKRNNDTDPHLVHEAVHLSIDAVIARSIAYLDRLILFQFAGPAALAEYWIALNFERQFTHMFKSMNSIAIPKLTSRSFSSLQKSLPRQLLLLYAILIPFTLCYILATPFAFRLLFPQYLSAIIYAQVFGLLFLLLPVKVLSDTFISHSKHRELYYITFLSSGPKLIATLVFVPWLGIWGVITSLFIEQIIHAGVILYFFFKKYDETHPGKDKTIHPIEKVNH
jgi:O-antigen/teichoic acid export membrane protein